MPLYKNGYSKFELEELKKRIIDIENDLNFLIMETAGLKTEIMFMKETINNLVKRIANIENNLKKD